MSWIKDVKTELAELDFSAKKLRQFNIVMLLFFTVLLVAWFFNGKEWILIVSSVGYILTFTGILIKPFGNKFYAAWMAIAFALGWIMSRVLLSIIYYLLVTPIGLVARITGKKFLDVSFKDGKNSYWVKRKNPQIDYTKMS